MGVHARVKALVLHWCIMAWCAITHSAYLLALVSVLTQLATQNIGQVVVGAEAVEVVDLVACQRGVGVGAGYDVDELGNDVEAQRGHASGD